MSLGSRRFHSVKRQSLNGVGHRCPTTTSILPDGRLRLGFFHYRCANRLTFFDQFYLAMLRETRASGDQVTHDHVFLEAAQSIDLTQRSGLCKNTSRILE